MIRGMFGKVDSRVVVTRDNRGIDTTANVLEQQSEKHRHFVSLGKSNVLSFTSEQSHGGLLLETLSYRLAIDVKM